ncbi:MAG: pilus assembly protein [Silicimonas sp.]|nr:pilus assembly protein [Silicimonas sp.]
MDMIDRQKAFRPFRWFVRSEAGTTLVEFALCIALFLLILFAVLDFGRLGYNWVVAEKAMQRAVRIASVRTTVCADVPEFHSRSDPNDGTFPAGTLCREQPGLCLAVSRQCLLSNPDPARAAAAATADEIWASIAPLMPNNAARENVLIRYDYDQRLGFLGGPYVPMITAELGTDSNSDGNFTSADEDFLFTFISPLSALAGQATGTSNSIPNSIPFPDISVSLPAEDLNVGNGG